MFTSFVDADPLPLRPTFPEIALAVAFASTDACDVIVQ